MIHEEKQRRLASGEEFENCIILIYRVIREEKQRRLASGEDSDDEEEDAQQKRQAEVLESMMLCEHLKHKITDVHGYFSDVLEGLLAVHHHLSRIRT